MASESRAAQRNVKTLIQAGLDKEDLAPIQDALDRLRAYEAVGTVEGYAFVQRRSDILGEYIERLPEPIQAAWTLMLRERNAL